MATRKRHKRATNKQEKPVLPASRVDALRDAFFAILPVIPPTDLPYVAITS